MSTNMLVHVGCSPLIDVWYTCLLQPVCSLSTPSQILTNRLHNSVPYYHWQINQLHNINIWVHPDPTMHLVHPNRCSMSSNDPLSSSGYPVIIYTHPMAEFLPIKTLVTRQLQMHIYMYMYGHDVRTCKCTENDMHACCRVQWVWWCRSSMDGSLTTFKWRIPSPSMNCHVTPRLESEITWLSCGDHVMYCFLYAVEQSQEAESSPYAWWRSWDWHIKSGVSHTHIILYM